MKIKVIDLLNLVYENKAPKKILYKYCEYEFNSGINDYRNTDNLELFSYLFSNEEQALNLEIEIIEDIPKKIEKLNYKYRNMYGNISAHRHSEVDIIDKVNELIDEINKLKKGE